MFSQMQCGALYCACSKFFAKTGVLNDVIERNGGVVFTDCGTMLTEGKTTVTTLNKKTKKFKQPKEYKYKNLWLLRNAPVLKLAAKEASTVAVCPWVRRI